MRPQTKADEFVSFMENIWEMGMKQDHNGVFLTQHPDYDQWFNAILTATKLGAERITTEYVREWHTYRFPDDSIVLIAPDGSEICPRTISVVK